MLYFSLLDEDEFLKALQPIALANESDEEAATATLAGLKPTSDIAAIRALVLAEEIADKRPALAAAVRKKAIVTLTKCRVINRVDKEAGLESRIRDLSDLSARLVELVPECDEAFELVADVISTLEASVSETIPATRYEADALLDFAAEDIEKGGFDAWPRHVAMIRNARKFYANSSTEH